MHKFESNKLVIIGNGFDLAHGLKTRYKDFLDWYMCKAYHEFCSTNYYIDLLIEITNKYTSGKSVYAQEVKTFEDVKKFIGANFNYSINYKSNFFQKILELFNENNWVDIETYYFKLLKSHFSSNNFLDKKTDVYNLNKEFDFLIEQLISYVKVVNEGIASMKELRSDISGNYFNKLFNTTDNKLKVINFNYTETLNLLRYAKEEDIVYIHGRASELDTNPIIFGYGDESDPAYQSIEDSGENMYLEHIKSFGYFKTNNYTQLLSFIDSAPYIVYIVGHSCGLSDRVLLNEIFEHSNCQKIDIFYHVRNDSTDNFKEITQEISRHFKPNNKNIMRRKIIDKNVRNVIPQN